MVHLKYTVAVESVPRRWFEQAVVTLYDLVAETRTEDGRLLLADGREVPDVRLVRGDHLRPGAVYEVDDDAHVRVEEWDRRSAVRVAQHVTDGAVTAEIEALLKGVERPREAELRGSLSSGGTSGTSGPTGTNRWASLQRATGTSHIRLDDWWDAASQEWPPQGSGKERAVNRPASPSAPAPLEARLDHRLGRVTVRARPGQLPDGRWAIRVSLTARGRSLLRPLTAVALLVTARALRRHFTRTLDTTAARWNDVVPGLVSQEMPHLRERILTTALETPETKAVPRDAL
ncbi:hypothetical protein SSPS47_09145 [Streptomyces sp. S4.7]|uniref:hypothetical protein n=1 Tax=Streptomyces sp. S4.7 TaxID=2705439 RepID=UPI0013977E25|nr:hypothetical protein [Streptomyces sp. S4.7]QHY95289.1 hypothetical protein SSPS47_09145 [Streptomyces sp. S4.7]